nr:MAG TPA: hypothetical protein [Inoviridae sp.]
MYGCSLQVLTPTDVGAYKAPSPTDVGGPATGTPRPLAGFLGAWGRGTGMIDPLITFALLAAIVAVSIGGARIVSWLLDRRDYTAAQQLREAQVIALARAEIAATKRGDLLAAAELAEAQERVA